MRLLVALASSATVLALAATAPVAASTGNRRDQGPSHGWGGHPAVTSRVGSSPTYGGGYPGAKPAPGGCGNGPHDSNFAESALALRPGTERLVGGAKAFFGRWSTYKASHTVSFAISRRHGSSTHLVGGFDCVTRGTQAMPPSWTNTTDPTLVWDL